MDSFLHVPWFIDQQKLSLKKYFLDFSPDIHVYSGVVTVVQNIICNTGESFIFVVRVLLTLSSEGDKKRYSKFTNKFSILFFLLRQVHSLEVLTALTGNVEYTDKRIRVLFFYTQALKQFLIYYVNFRVSNIELHKGSNADLFTLLCTFLFFKYKSLKLAFIAHNNRLK